MQEASGLTDKIMNEVLSELDSRFDYVSQYKQDVGIGIPYSQTSDKFQEQLKNHLIKKRAATMHISEENALQIFEKNMEDELIFTTVKQKGEKETKDFLALNKGFRTETDAIKKEELRKEYDAYRQNILQEITPKQKSDFMDSFINMSLQQKHVENKMRSELNASLKTNSDYNTDISLENDKGYCLKSIVTSLYDANKKYNCMNFLPHDIETAVHPSTFVEALKSDEKHAKHVYATDENTSLRDLIEDHKIEKGAIVMLCGGDGKPHHAMFYAGEKDADGEPLLSGFNSEDKNILASVSKSGRKRQGIIIDIHSLVSEGVQQKFPTNYLASVRNKIKPQAQETPQIEPERKSTLSPIMTMCALQQSHLK